MSTAQEQLRYIPCNLCNIVLAVSVPCSSLFEMVTVRCGHCTNVWSVNMAAAAPFHHSLASTIPPPHPFLYNHRHHHLHQAQEYRIDLGSCSRYMSSNMLSPTTHVNRVVNRPPEKRQRVPSAYNQFIKEEIQRIKASNPDITHREAFSTAAKNWAHFPHIHFGAN